MSAARNPTTTNPRHCAPTFRRCVAFALGRIITTPGAARTLKESGESYLLYATRHASGDWREMYYAEREENARALKEGRGVFSTFHTKAGAQLWVATEADRSRTTIFVPSEAGETVFNERVEHEV